MTYDVEDVEENQTAPYGCKTAQTDCHVVRTVPSCRLCFKKLIQQ